MSAQGLSIRSTPLTSSEHGTRCEAGLPLSERQSEMKSWNELTRQDFDVRNLGLGRS